MRHSRALLLPFLTGLVLLLPASASAYQMLPAYNQRYCEILFADSQGAGLHLTVFNTFGLNSCPTNLWKNVDLPKLAHDHSHLTAVANGPRWWILDRLGGDIDGTTMDMGGGLMMRQVATLDLPSLSPPAAYTEVQINRTTTWSYNKSRYLRRLLSPTGHHYLMQAYTTMIDPRLNEAKLNTLASARGTKLRLPRGWKYQVFRSTRKLDLVIPDHATVLQDNLKNTYQKVD